MCRIVKIFITGLLFLVVSTPSPVWALAFNFNVDTTSLAGTAATLAFDFINGDSAVNTAQINNFLTDGSFDPNLALITGDVSGSLSSTVTFSDTSFFNELLQPITLGNTFRFQLDTTNAFAGGTPDSFSFFILDSSGFPLGTTDPISGSNALFALDLNGTGNGNLSVFASTSTQPNQPTWSVVPVQSVPEPSCLGLMLIGGWSVYLRKKRLTNPKAQ
jgi:hypothetical protein